MEDPLFRVWSGLQFEALLIRDAAHRSNLCTKCKNTVTAAVTLRLDEINILAQLENLTLGPHSPALQGARYWQTLPDPSAPAKDTRIKCEKDNHKIAVDAATILYALKKTPAYQDLKTRWVVGKAKYEILFALEGTMEKTDLLQVYDTLPPPYDWYRVARTAHAVFGKFAEMHWVRYKEFESESFQLLDETKMWIYPCECLDLKLAHDTIIQSQGAAVPWTPYDAEDRFVRKVVWAIQHITMHVTGSVEAWKPNGSVGEWVARTREAVEKGKRERLIGAVTIVYVMLAEKEFDSWLIAQVGAVEAEVALMDRMVGHARATAAGLEAELRQETICPGMEAMSMNVDG